MEKLLLIPMGYTDRAPFRHVRLQHDVCRGI